METAFAKTLQPDPTARRQRLRELIAYERIGRVPEGCPVVPLVEGFRERCKYFRLSHGCAERLRDAERLDTDMMGVTTRRRRVAQCRDSPLVLASLACRVTATDLQRSTIDLEQLRCRLTLSYVMEKCRLYLQHAQIATAD